MYDLLVMDLRRIRKSRCLYILLGVQAVMLLFVCGMILLLTNPGLRDMLNSWGMEVTQEEYTQMAALLDLSMAEALFQASLQGGFYFALLYGLTGALICHDFHSGFAKNIFSLREKRVGYAISKFLAMELVNVIFFLFEAVVFWLLCCIMGLKFAPLSLLEYAKLLPVVLAIGGGFAAQAMAVAFFTRSQGVCIGAAILLAGGVVPMLLSRVLEFFKISILDKLLYGAMSSLTFPLEGNRFWNPILVGIAWTIIYFPVAAVLLKKKDI